MHHIPEADRVTAFAEMFRVTRPSGRLLIADFRPFALGTAAARHEHAHGIDLAALAGMAAFRIEAGGQPPAPAALIQPPPRPALHGLMRCDNDQMLRRAGRRS